MDRTFKSKVDWWYHLLMVIIVMFCVGAVLGQNIWFIIFILLSAALAVHVFLDTHYTITADGILIVHCSIFPEKKIAVADIQALEPTMMPVFSYALSLDRLIIWSGNKPWMMISPVNKNGFVKVLREINPDIQIRKENQLL